MSDTACIAFSQQGSLSGPWDWNTDKQGTHCSNMSFHCLKLYKLERCRLWLLLSFSESLWMTLVRSGGIPFPSMENESLNGRLAAVIVSMIFVRNLVDGNPLTKD